MINRVIKKIKGILSKQQLSRVAILSVLMVIGGFLETISISLMMPFISSVMNPDEIMVKWYAKIVINIFGIEDSRAFLVLLAVILAAIYIGKNVYLLFEYNIQFRFVYNNMLIMQRRLLASFVRKPYEYYLKINSGDIIRIINNDTPNAFTLLLTLLNLLTEIIVSGMIILSIFIIVPGVTTCIALVLGLLLLAIGYIIKPQLRKAGITMQSSSAGMNKWLIQSIHGIKELKVMRREKYFEESFDVHGRQYVNSLRKSKMLEMMPRFFIEAFSMSTLFVAVAVMIFAGNDLASIIPILSAVAMAALRLLPSVNRISNSVANIALYEPMLDKLIEVIDDNDAVLNKTDIKEQEYHKFRINQVHRDIVLNNISFRYPDTDVDVLAETGLTIKKGESIGIVGSSGAGKSTTVDVLLGLLTPQKGSILVDGVDIVDDLQGWYKQIGYIPQTIFMLDDTIRNNICFGIEDKDISDQGIWKVLKDTALVDFVKSLPNGLETEIGERGVRLSGGQRQRIGIARALYNKPAVLIFDEATSALDNDTEAEIMESIKQLQNKKTMVIIAHRLTTIQDCDHIYRVEQGKITKER